jgi:cytochrome P450
VSVDVPKTAHILQGRPDPFAPPPTLVAQRDKEAVSRVEFPDGAHGWIVTRHEEVRRILADARFSSARSRVMTAIRKLPDGVQESTPPGLFVGMDPPEHTRFRKVLTGYFTVKRMRELGPRIEEIVAERLDALEAAPRPADFVDLVAQPIPLLVVCELLGVPEDRRADFVRRVNTVQRTTSTEEELREARDGNRASMLEIITAKRTRPDDGLISTIVHASDDNGAPFTPAELMGMCLLLLVAGHDPTVQMLAMSTYTLLRRPAQAAELRAHPDRIVSAVEELLRFLTVQQFGVFRTATQDVEVGGQTIRAGDPVLLALLAANHDPHHFRDADALDLQRPPSQHLSFGHGIHQCLGQQLARVELGIALRAIVARMPKWRLAVPPEDLPMRADMGVYGLHELPLCWDDPA